MALNDTQNGQQIPKMPDVEQKPAATAGKWLIWFIIIFAIVMALIFIF